MVNTGQNTATRSKIQCGIRVHNSGLEYAVEYSKNTGQNTATRTKIQCGIQVPKSSIEYAVEYSKNTLHHDTEYDVFI